MLQGEMSGCMHLYSSTASLILLAYIEQRELKQNTGEGNRMHCLLG